MTPRRIIIGGTDVTEHIARVVAEAPPFTDEQRALLRVLLAPDRPVASKSSGTRRPGGGRVS